MDEYEATKKLFAHLSDERLRTLYEAVKKHATKGDPTDRALLAHMERMLAELPSKTKC
jgi:hypothetical protein